MELNKFDSSVDNFRLNSDLDAAVLAAARSRVMSGVYLKMFLGLLTTAAVSFLTVSSSAMLNFIYTTPMVMWGLLIAELVVVFVLSARLDRMSDAKATALFYAYAVLNGVTLSSIFFVYQIGSIASAFLLTAVMFGVMSVYGYVTKKDLSSFGNIMFMGLIGLIVCTLVNLFLRSAMMDWIISFAGIMIFVGLTAWDTQRIKAMVYQADRAYLGKIATIGALSLYLDFINIFLYILRFLGNSRD